MPHRISQAELFHYTSIWPHTTGLHTRVWIPDEGAKDGNIRVQTTHTAASLPNEVSLVSISEEPELVDGALSAADLTAVRAFVVRNLAALRAHRNGDCDSAELAERLRR